MHSGYSGNEEFNWHGAHGVADDTAKVRLDPKPNASGEPAAIVGSAGATAVWAEENTRASIFDAMKRKETYGTSGPLIRLRFFGAWDYADDLTSDEEFVKKAYANGVPMGGDLAAQLEGAVGPTFAVQALKDPQSGNLDRIQVVKGWVERGKAKERIYNVALSDERTVGKKGKVAPVGNTVDIGKATYTNDIGDTQLSVVWTDPDFNPKQRAVYYVRVLEIPTPRWSTYDAAKLGVQPPRPSPQPFKNAPGPHRFGTRRPRRPRSSGRRSPSGRGEGEREDVCPKTLRVAFVDPCRRLSESWQQGGEHDAGAS